MWWSSVTTSEENEIHTPRKHLGHRRVADRHEVLTVVGHCLAEGPRLDAALNRGLALLEEHHPSTTVVGDRRCGHAIENVVVEDGEGLGIGERHHPEHEPPRGTASVLGFPCQCVTVTRLFRSIRGLEGPVVTVSSDCQKRKGKHLGGHLDLDASIVPVALDLVDPRLPSVSRTRSLECTRCVSRGWS